MSRKRDIDGGFLLVSHCVKGGVSLWLLIVDQVFVLRLIAFLFVRRPVVLRVIIV
jgi:hypothetical protein